METELEVLELGPRGTATLQAIEQFLQIPYTTKLARCLFESPEAWATIIAQETFQSVPAYRQFLSDQGLYGTSLEDWVDFQKLPVMTKENYVQVYPLAKRCRYGQIESCDMVAFSSGSSGQPSVWPRYITDELEIAYRFEQIFSDSFQADRTKTLAVVCFALGTWVGGMFTTQCCRYLSMKNYPVTVVTPGNNPAEIFRVVEELGPQFEQVVLLGYPPFLKTIVDQGIEEGIQWNRYGVKLVTAGEIFSEDWRTLMGERLGSLNPYFSSVAMYGTADAGVLGNETPLTVSIRRFLASRPDVVKMIFGQERMPTLVQFDPMSRYLECLNDQIVITGENGVPLVRYNILDHGGIVPFEVMMRILAQVGFDPIQELVRYLPSALNGELRGVHRLPFAFIFGRTHLALSFFGANIYPENVTVGLEQPGIREWVSGKFVMEIKEDLEQNPQLYITIEVAPAHTPEELESLGAVSLMTHAILTQLHRLNSEFAHYVPQAYQIPVVKLRPYGDPEYFPPGVKHRYTRR